MNQEKIGKFIQEKRKEKQITQDELANELGISKNAVSKWERGICLMDLSQLKPLCKILDISLQELLSGGEEKGVLSNELLESTIEYSEQKIKRNRRRITLTVVIVLLIGVVCYYWFFVTFTVPKIVNSAISQCEQQELYIR